jgi:hypothetical protein
MPGEPQAAVVRSKSVEGTIPIAQPAAPARAKVPPAPDEPPPPEPIVTPESIQGWASSLALHALLLLAFAFWVFTPARDAPKTIETVIGGGEGGGGGGEGSSDMEGLGNLDQPLVLEPPPPEPEREPPPLNQLNKLSEIAISPSASLKAAAPHAADADSDGDGLPRLGSGGGGEGFGPARFGIGSEKIKGVEVKVGDPQFTLIWDTQADIDLHVIEPGGSEIYWELRHGDQGGELDVDDIDGFGPENIYWVQGKGPPGQYKWFVHYFGGLGGVAVPTTWKVRIKHDGQAKVYTGKLRAPGAKSKTHTLIVAPSANEAPKEAAKAP